MNPPNRLRLTDQNRRVFLQTAIVGATALVGRQTAIASSPAGAEAIIRGKDARLVVHAAGPCQFETPVELLGNEAVTPLPLVFVRNNQQPADATTLEPPKVAGWNIELASLVENPQSFAAATLAELPQIEQTMVLQCSGNGRSLFAPSAPTKGTQWGRGGMANVQFAGVPLAALLKHLGVKIKPEAKFLTAEGRDDPAPGEQDFEHSIPLDEALGKTFLALRMNGQPLSAIHGGPVRLVTPGYYGTMQVKWLSRLRFEAGESNHTSQIPHYRTPRRPITPGEAFQPTFENSEPNWRMKIKCVVLSPVPGAKLASGDVTVRGVAFNDGETRIEQVLVSTDAGQTWKSVPLEAPASPYAWYRWSARLNLARGKQPIWARAVDALGRTQPLDGGIHWNPQGYTWNGVEKIDVMVG